MTTFFNSNAFIGIVTLVGGIIAYVIYKKQQRDSKKDAANIILLEIQYAERILAQVGEGVRTGILSGKSLLPNESWSKNKYLFVRDLDRDEWDNLTEFYNNCKNYDDAILYNNSFFQKNEEQIRVNLLRVSAEYIKQYIDQPSQDEKEDTKNFEAAVLKATKFQTAFLSKAQSFFYGPQKPLTDARTAFDSITKNISQTSLGTKLKRLSKL